MPLRILRMLVLSSIFVALGCHSIFADDSSLYLHLDAQSLSEIGDGKPIASWPNLAASGAKTLTQEVGDSQPTVKMIGEHAVVRFEGLNQQLRSIGNARTTRAATIVIVAAPHRNLGNFQGLLSANANDQRDYTSGVCVDLGPAASQKLDYVNVEGLGFTTAADLCDQVHAFGQLRVFVVIVDAEKQRVTMRIDGQETGSRPYSPADISLDEWTIGARYVSEGPGNFPVQNAFEGDIAEVRCYTTALATKDVAALESELQTKYKTLAENLPDSIGSEHVVNFKKVENPPLVQMLVPGFEVRELPLELTNVNSLRYRDDGKLVTLGYNGDIHLLSDTDGDGLEDHAELFWKNTGSLRGPIGMVLTPPNYKLGRGLFTPSKGKLSLIVDKDGDDRADEEVVVATGWNEIVQNVDATGLAMDKDGSLYFGLGTADYSNAYLVDVKGQAKYDIRSDRGTVQKVSPDFKTRETVCTGIRFPIAFAFNENGHLFCTEQEGATWLANGNPFDELLHIQPDRHYGFPPRHPRHNSNVLDEPSVFDYGPQHQSTCGMVFNASVNGGRNFGPEWWRNDAIVCGESRGKLWRTQLVNTSAGYVAQTQLLACLQMLTVDTCVAPNGDLLVACHSGPPDWGTGPTGIGKLFRIRRREELPLPTNFWISGEREMTIAFDAPLAPESVQGITDQITVYFGDHVRAGDEFETLAPPYAVVQRQLVAKRKQLDVYSVALSQDRRNLLLQTDPVRIDTHYAVSIPYRVASQPDSAAQVLGLDCAADGVIARLENATGATLWSGWLPHVNWGVNSTFTQLSSSHDALRNMISEASVLKVSTNLDLSDVLRPKVQPGSQIDYDWPEERVTIVLRSSAKFDATILGETHASQSTSGVHELSIPIDSKNSSRVPLQINFQLDSTVPFDSEIVMFTNEDGRPRALPLTRFKLPAVSKQAEQPEAAEQQIAEIEGGSWGRGRRIFHSQAASCFKCHAIHGPGEKIGPDLTNLVHRDYASVLRDIKNPSFAINPDHLGQILVMEDDRVLTGVLRTENGRLLLGDANGIVTVIPRDEIAAIKPSEVSIMPAGLTDKLSEQEFRDLMTFLLTPPPHMPLDSPLKAPPVRTQAEVAAVLGGAEPLPEKLDAMNIVLVAGLKDHGPGEHDYPAWQIQWHQLLTAADAVTVENAWDFPSDQQLESADVLVFFQKGAWNDERQQKMDAYFARGGGAVYIHWAVNGDDRVADFSQRIGLASKGGSIAYRHGPLSLQVHSTDHPIMRNIEPLQLYDESYWLLTGNPQDVTLFATSDEDGEARPQLWSYTRGKGRVFVSIPGHYNWTFDDPIFRTILLRGVAWSAEQPVDRFNVLVPLGARMTR